MADLIIYILIISIYNSILFFGKRFGLNVILFNIPLLTFLYNILRRNKKINNKKGLLFMIPIILLSTSYLIYDNIFFKIFNIFVIIALFMLMYVYTMKKDSKISELIIDVIKLMFLPLSHIDKYYRVVKIKIDSIITLSETNKKKIKSLFVVMPIIITILFLLSSADMIFNNIFKIFNKIPLDNTIERIISVTILFTYLGSTINYLLFGFLNSDDKTNNKSYKIESYTIKLLLTILNIIYIVFDFIQIRSLIFHHGLSNINYAQYARSGFFQLMCISIINLIILLVSKKAKQDTKYNKTMSIIMIFLTFIIIISSFLRMYMYESAYGYTLLRLLVYVTLITETVLLIPTLVYIINPKINILNCYVIITVTAYTILSLSPVDYFIAKNNISRYYKVNKIDMNYLQNYSTDNIPLLYDFYNNIEKKGDKYYYNNLKNYFKYMYKMNKNDSIFEYNISRSRAVKLLKNKITN